MMNALFRFHIHATFAKEVWFCVTSISQMILYYTQVSFLLLDQKVILFLRCDICAYISKEIDSGRN